MQVVGIQSAHLITVYRLVHKPAPPVTDANSTDAKPTDANSTDAKPTDATDANSTDATDAHYAPWYDESPEFYPLIYNVPVYSDGEMRAPLWRW